MPLVFPGPVVIIDTETGGLDPSRHSILSVGMVVLGTNQECEVFISEPTISAEPEALAINGINLEWLRAVGLSPQAAVLSIEEFRTQVSQDGPITFAGHNLSFDVGFLRRLYTIAGAEWPRGLTHRTVDTHSLLWALAVSGKIPASACGSEGAFAFFGIDAPGRHTALGDARATSLLLARLIGLISAEQASDARETTRRTALDAELSD